MSDAGKAENTAGSQGGPPVLSAVAAQWADRPPEETLHTAALADELGYPELWIGETATYDAFALATAIGLATERVHLTIGPLAVAVRDPAMVAMGAASVASLTRRPVRVALGTSSPRLVRDWHGRSTADGAAALADGAQAVAELLAGEAGGEAGGGSGGFPLRLPAPGGGVTVAAFGSGAVRAAAEFGDRMVLDMVSVETAGRLRSELDAEAARLGRGAPRLAVWLPAAVDPEPEALAQLIRGLVPYLGLPGYHAMFTEAGFGEVADLARGGAGYQEVVRALPLEIVGTIGLVGSRTEIAKRIAAYGRAGVDEIAIVPATAGDRGGASTLTALHDLKA